jgi:chromosome segregation ATPase
MPSPVVVVPESPAMPVLFQLRNMLCYDTDDLLDQKDDFAEMVKELQDYSWRLTDSQKEFLAVVQELNKRFLDDGDFIETTETVDHCQKELSDALERRIEMVKEHITSQEKVMAFSLSAEEAIDNRIDELESQLKPLVKRKRNLQMDIQYDVAKLIRTRSHLSRLQEKDDALNDDIRKTGQDFDAAKKLRSLMEDCHTRAVEAAYKAFK